MSKRTLNDFEEFTSRRLVLAGDPKVSLLKQGRIGLNKFCDEQYFKDCSHVKLYWNKDRQEIGIRGLKEAAEGAYPIKRTTTTYVSAIAFFRHAGLPVDEATENEIVEWNEEERVLFIKVKK